MSKKLLCTIAALFTAVCVYAQQAVINGIVKDDNGKPVEAVTVAVEGTDIGTHTNSKGYYSLEVPAERRITVVFSLLSYNKQTKTLSLKAGENRTLDIKLKILSGVLKDVVIKDDQERYEPGMIKVHAEKANIMPSAVGGIEGMLKTFVGSNNELTSQYSVRGGNYDENLVYVNDFEIYRPFLVRSGQQEGLSFINPDLVSSVDFSVGGFQAKYGDKMSSVLDVKYKHPTKFAGSVMGSLLGGSLHLEGASKNKKLTYLFGARQKSNQYLLQSQPTKGVYNPSFTDIQALVNYRFNDKWEMEFIGNYARNRFTFIPETATTTFGVLNQAYQLDVYYEGGEIDQFDSRFGGFSTTYKPNKRLKFKLLLSGFQTNEDETYDISGEYLLGQIETDLGKQNFGQIIAAKGTGLIQNYTRDFLTANVGNAGLRGSYDADKHFFQWGLDANIVNINDKLHEWQRRDSSDFNQPYSSNEIQMASLYDSPPQNFNYMRYSGFVQDNFRFSDSSGLTGSFGIRYSYSTLNSESIFSPRLQLAEKPVNWKRDMIFKLAAGIYAQPPFYREMRDLNGNINKDLKAQKSYHVVLGTDYNFKMYDRPFRVTAELYYKGLWDLDPYVYNDIQVRYYAKNDAVGYVYGGEVRLFGDLVKDATSWVSIGLMKAAYSITDDSFGGYTPLPNDQRFMLGMYFEDYLPNNKNFKVHLSMLYSSGLPFGPPNKPAYADTLRMPAYKRVDIGFSALLLDASRREHHAHSLFRNVKSIWASLEVFNLLAIQNTISYTWIQDQTSGRTYAVPNYLTTRLLNAKLLVNF